MASTTDVFPRRNLGPAEEWGRTVETRVVGAEMTGAINAQGLAGLNRSTAATLENLAGQIEDIAAVQASQAAIQADLIARRTYANSGGSFSTTTTGSTVFGSAMASIDFSLNEDRKVQLITSAAYSGSGSRTSGTNSLVLRGNLFLRIDGTSIGDSTADSTIQWTSSGPARYQFSGGSLIVARTVTLAAGDHTMDARPSGYIGADSGSFTIDTFNNTVTILEKA